MSTESAPAESEAPAPDVERPPFLERVYALTVGRAVSWLRTVPIRARLVAIIAILLAVGLGATGAITQAYVSHYLSQQVDEQLRTTANTSLDTISSAGPGELFIEVRWETGEPVAFGWPPTVQLHGRPVIPDLTPDQAARRGGQPFTVKSTGGTSPTDWRVVAVSQQWPDREAGVVRQAVVYIALPLSRVKEASDVLARTLLGAGLGIILLGAGAAWLLVHRSLRPLQEIETTAAAIAAGDYTRRIPSAPERTEVGSLGASLNAMLAQIEMAFAGRDASERRMRRFVSDASHELRTPLATIRGYGELYRMGALDSSDKVDDTMARIEDAARRMGLLVNDLLVLARLDEGRPLRAEKVDLTAMARDAAQDLVALDPSRAVRVVGLDVDDPPEALTVTGDADRLRQVLTNLVGNVARHTPAGTAVELALGTTLDAVDATRGSAVLEVRDHGPGVPPELAGRMFERFFRADSSRNRESGGSGLGLAIVAAIVGAHHGHVTTRSPAEGGLVVRVEVPLGSPGHDGAGES